MAHQPTSLNRSNGNGNNNSKSKGKSPHKKWTNSKHKKSGKQKGADEYDPNNPGQYMYPKGWSKMTNAEIQASRDTRNKKDRRNLQSVTTGGATAGAATDLRATVVDLTRRLDAITARAQAAAASTNGPPPLQPILKQAPRYSLKMTQRHGPVAVTPPAAEFYVDASGNPTHQKE